jgi:hypothetical protein
LIISMLATLVALFITFFLSDIIRVVPLATTSPKTIVGIAADSLHKLSNEIYDLKRNLADIRNQLDSFKTLSEESKVGLQLAGLRTEIEKTQSSLSKIEDVILDNPSKALSLPLLQKDMENLRQSYKTDLGATKDEISRIYDLSKWFVGLVCTMVIGLLGLAISNFLQGKKKE